jgi:hypothetical protein
MEFFSTTKTFVGAHTTKRWSEMTKQFFPPSATFLHTKKMLTNIKAVCGEMRRLLLFLSRYYLFSQLQPLPSGNNNKIYAYFFSDGE